MDFYNCPYVVVIPFRNRNEYDEAIKRVMDFEKEHGIKG